MRQINYGQHYPQKEKNEGNKSRGGGWVSGGAIAGIVIGVAAVIAIIVFMAAKYMGKKDSGAVNEMVRNGPQTIQRSNPSCPLGTGRCVQQAVARCLIALTADARLFLD